MATAANPLKKLLSRRHPDYDRRLPHWNFVEATYAGGRDWFAGNIFPYHKEGEGEHAKRVARAYRFNHTREIVDLVQKYIFKTKIARSVDAPGEVKQFWKNCTLSNMSIDQFMSMVSTESSKYGRIWIFLDTTKKDGAISVADEKNSGARVYAYIVRPQDLLDIAFDEETGEVRWALVRERKRDDDDPLSASGEMREQFRLWDRNGWKLYRQDPVTGRGARQNYKIEEVRSGTHQLGAVPCFPVDHVIGDNSYSARGLVDDIVYLDRATANYLSNLDAIIQDQTFSQLAIPYQSLILSEEKDREKLVEMGTKRIFTYDGGEGGAAPFYLSPDPRQATLIVTVVNKIIAEIYHTVGAAGERTKQDNAVGIDNSSGVAKAYDFERLNSLLAAKAASLNNAEDRLVELVQRLHGVKNPKNDHEWVRYPETFDVRSLYDEFGVAEKLLLIEAPDGVRREQMRQVIDKLFPAISRSIREKMEKELDEWPPEPPVPAPLPTAIGATPRTPGKSPNSSSAKNPSSANRQGQVTDASQKKSA